MRAAVSPALRERQVRVAFVIDALCGEALDLFRKQVRVVRDRHALRFFAEVNDARLVLDQRPFKRELVAVDIEALNVLTRRFEERASYFKRQLLVADLEQRAFY